MAARLLELRRGRHRARRAASERVLGLILIGVNARGAWAPDYPWAMTVAAMENWIAQLQAGWGGPTSLAAFAPSVAREPEVQAWWTRTLHAVDVRQRLPGLRVPTLVVQRRDDSIVRAGAARYLAATIPGAELLMVEGTDHFFWHGDSDTVLASGNHLLLEREDGWQHWIDEVREFLF